MTDPIRILSTAARAGAVLAVCGTLQACGQYGPKGDRGLPPAPEGVAYPNINNAPTADNRTLRSPGEQERIKGELLARKRQR